MEAPDDRGSAVGRDIRELREAANLGLAKTTLLLCGVIAEALLLERHVSSIVSLPKSGG
jgi:hypothetical protein